MSPTPPKAISIEQLGFALDALGWQPSTLNPRAASRTEMLGLLRFIVEAELLQFDLDDAASNEEATVGFMLGLETRTQNATSTPEEYALAYLSLWLNLITRQAQRAGAEVVTALEAVDPAYGTDRVARALTLALVQLMRAPSTVAGTTSSAPAVKTALEKTRPFLQEARQHLEDGRRKLKQLGRH